ncbi:uncharacterized protein At4g15970-like [Cryptomeria japonica]|uniref:uncharacterized protein At4g15970-like n=1 Tax=Cryptomeria japonica TaxID=3369 RepID=UPI0027D9E80A|nr:uncharacterized protein At4g15970-like [Cryptomeria japonica]
MPLVQLPEYRQILFLLIALCPMAVIVVEAPLPDALKPAIPSSSPLQWWGRRCMEELLDFSFVSWLCLGWPSTALVTLAPAAGDGSGWPIATTSKFPHLALAISPPSLQVPASTFPPANQHLCCSVSTFMSGNDLKESLSKAANQEKTVLITTLNAAWAQNNSMLDFFLKSFHIGNGTEALLKNLLIVAVDEKALNRCREIHPHCYLMKTEGVDFSGEELYMTQDYLKMMWRRLLFFGEVLERGYNFLFSDADIMWFRDPFTKFSSRAEFQIASDYYTGKPDDLHNSPNGGFMYVHSNEKTVEFFKFWYQSKKVYLGKNEQDVLNILKWKEFRSRGLEVEFLDTKYFGGYCQRTNDLNSVCTMHANCCKGLKAKLIDLRNTLSDWEKSKRQEHLGKGKDVRWTFANACSHSWRR